MEKGGGQNKSKVRVGRGKPKEVDGDKNGRKFSQGGGEVWGVKLANGTKIWEMARFCFG